MLLCTPLNPLQVKVGNDQEMVQSERNSHNQKTEVGIKLN